MTAARGQTPGPVPRPQPFAQAQPPAQGLVQPAATGSERTRLLLYAGVGAGSMLVLLTVILLVARVT
jgi:hypothetical protein